MAGEETSVVHSAFNTRRRCLWTTLVEPDSKRGRKRWFFTWWGEDLGPPYPRMLRCRCTLWFRSSTWAAQALGNLKRVNGQSKHFKPLRVEGEKSLFLPAGFSVGMNCKVGVDSFLLLPSKFWISTLCYWHWLVQKPVVSAHCYEGAFLLAQQLEL